MSGESSLELLERIRAGDRGALDELIARYLPRLRRWASGRLPEWAREQDETDDLVQDTVIRSLEKLEGFDPHHEAALHAHLRQARSIFSTLPQESMPTDRIVVCDSPSPTPIP